MLLDVDYICAHTYVHFFIHYTIFIALDLLGWKRSDSQLAAVWETEENPANARERVQHVLNGCKCKTGCTTKRCKCKKQLHARGPGCHCLNCHNTPTHQASQEVDEEIHQMEVDDHHQHQTPEEYVEDESDEDDQLETNDEELDEIMVFVFGPESDSEEVNS